MKLNFKRISFNENTITGKLAVYALTDLFSRALPFLVFPVVISYLNPSEFGLVTNFNILMQIFGAFIGIHLTTYLTASYYKTDSKTRKTIFSSTIQLHFLIFIFLLLIPIFFYNNVNAYFQIERNYQLFGLFTVLFTSISSVVSTYYRLEEKIIYFSFFSLSNVLLSTLLTYILLHYFNLGVLGRILSIVLPSVFFGLLSIGILFKNNLISYSLSFSEIKNQLKFGIPMLPHTLSFWLKSGFDRLLVTNFIGLTANGIFSIGATFASIFFILNNAFNNAYVPSLYKKLSNENISIDEKKTIVKEIYLYVIIFFILLVLGYFVINFVIINFFVKYKESLIYLPYFLCFNFFNVLYQVSVNFIFFVKKTKYLGATTLFVSLLQGLLSYILINYFGLHGAGIAMLVCSIVLFIIVFIYSRKVYNMPWFLIL